jgi:xanthine dehydrogenase accessory factor
LAADLDIWRLAAELAARGDPFVMLTVIDAKGSTPRDSGARMIWRPGVGFFGTVGGGQFEHLALASAEKHFADRSRGVEHFVLSAEAEQCCGGTMDVFYEFCGPSRRLVIFGAGHVSSALASLLAAAPLEIVVADDRTEWNTPERFPRCRRIARWGEAVAIACERREATLACVMTCSHDTDFDLLRRLLESPPAFVGLIGSRSKRACLFRRLVASGVDQKAVQAVHCPIGLGDMGKQPELIAVSMAGQVLLEAKRLARL